MKDLVNPNMIYILHTLRSIEKIPRGHSAPSAASKSARGKYAINSRRKSSKLIWPTRELAGGESWSQPTNHRVQQTIYHRAVGIYHHIYGWDLDYEKTDFFCRGPARCEAS